MKQAIDFSLFDQAFRNYDRQSNFTPKGLRRLFEYLEEYEESTGEQIELDVISLCCDYTEESLSDVLKNYSLESLEELRDSTTVIMVGEEKEEDPIVNYQVF
jgi:hypothetical protein